MTLHVRLRGGCSQDTEVPFSVAKRDWGGRVYHYSLHVSRLCYR